MSTSPCFGSVRPLFFADLSDGKYVPKIWVTVVARDESILLNFVIGLIANFVEWYFILWEEYVITE